MKHVIKTFTAASLVCASTMMLSGCGSSSSSTEGQASIGLPEGLSLSMLNKTTGAYYRFDSTTETRTDLNALAAGSLDSAVQKLAIADPSEVGYIFHWPDFREVNGEDQQDMKYLVMDKDYQDGFTIDSSEMIQLVHFHDDDLAAHSADEFAIENAPAGSGKALGLERLNSFVDEQIDLDRELAEVMPDGTQLCRAYVDPYIKYEEEHEEEATGETMGTSEEEEHEHHDLMHFALDTSGVIHFFTEEDNGLEQAQGFVQLDDVTSINSCLNTTIARVSEDGILVFIPDTQKLYLVDSHGGDYHQHSTWDVSALLPEGETTDLVALIGEGEEHEHEE